MYQIISSRCCVFIHFNKIERIYKDATYGFEKKGTTQEYCLLF